MFNSPDPKMPTKKPNGLVAGAEEADVTSWPGLVAIYLTQEDVIKIQCGGSLVTKRHVVTG